MPLSPVEALQRLREGNRRFVAHAGDEQSRRWSAAHVEGQNPFAVVLGCSDSRAPAEFVFDVGLGDLFVVRVAGNIVAPSQIGSIEFAVSAFETPLVVVMGHTRCGAVAATVREIESGDAAASRDIHAITSRIRPFVEPIVIAARGAEREAVLREAMRANVRASVAQLQHTSRLLEERCAGRTLAVVGAEYELESGSVLWL